MKNNYKITKITSLHEINIKAKNKVIKSKMKYSRKGDKKYATE